MSENKLSLSQRLETKVQSFMNETVDSIVGQYQSSKETNKDYKGRQLLELLQNAYDAHDQDADIHKVYIELTDTQLIIKNTGIGFSEEGVRSLLTSNLSPKDNNSIGNKGLGFRSILNWASKIHIQSDSAEEEGLWSFAFSREYAKERFEQLGKKQQEQAREIAQDNEEYPIATLKCPKWDTSIKKDNDYTTIITLNLKEGASDDIKKQFNEINENTLVFLPALSEIEIVFDDYNIIYKKATKKVTDSIDKIIIKKYNDGNNTTKQWTAHNEKGTVEFSVENNDGENYIGKKDYHLAIAYQDDFSDDAYNLFSFFSTKVPFEIPALVHGTFDLEGNRNNISNIDLNKKLLKKLSDLLIKAAQYISDSEDVCSWHPLSLIYFDKGRYNSRLEELGFYGYHLEQIRNSKLFPCHDGKYRTIKDILLFRKNFSLHYHIHDILKYKKFNILENLLLYTDDKRCFQLICIWSKNFIDDDNVIINQINSISHKLSEDERVKTIHFVSKYTELHSDRKLNLLVDKDNNVIENYIEAYTPETKEGIKFKIPQHINLRFMSGVLYKKLITIFEFDENENENPTNLQDCLKDFLNIHAYKPNIVIKKIISGTDKKEIKQIKAMIESLYSAFSSLREKNESPNNLDIVIHLIDKEDNIIRSRDLYLGTPYEHGKLIENIYKEIDINYLATPEDLGLLDKPHLESFFKWLGVNEFYRKEVIKIEHNYPDPPDSYRQWLSQREYGNSEGVYSFKYITEIFRYNCIEYVLYLLKISGALEDNGFLSDKDDISFFQWEIKNLIPTKSGVKSSPKECLLPNLNLELLSPVLETIEIDEKKLKDVNIGMREAQELLHKIGIYRNFDEIEDNKIKEILANLHTSDNEGKQAKQIYSLVLEKYSTDKAAEIELQCEGIKVYCEEGKEYNYFLSNDAYYLDRPIYPKAILERYPLITIGYRKGMDKIKRIFDVEPLKDLEIFLDSNYSEENTLNIQEDIDKVKPYILALRLKNLNGKNYHIAQQSIINMRVQLMSTLAVRLDEKTITLSELDYHYEKNIFYVSTKCNSLKELRKNIRYIELIGLLFSTALEATSDEDKYINIYKDEHNRDHILNRYTDNSAHLFLGQAEELLDTLSNKSKFWNDIAVLKGIDKKIKNNTDNKNINKIFGLNINVNEIDYKNISAKNNYILLKDVFTKLQITLEQFNNISTSKIDVINYFNDRLNSEKDRVNKIYKAYIWHQLNNKEIKYQKELEKRWNRYEDIKFTDIRNDFKFNVGEYFSNCLYEKTKVSLVELNNLKIKEFENDYFNFKKNKKEYLLNLLWEENDEHLSYFKNHHEELNKQYNLLEDVEQKNKSQENKEEIKEQPLYMEAEIYSPGDPMNVIHSPSIRKNSYNSGGEPSHNKKYRTGWQGEKIVYEFLEERYPTVNWVSGYAKKSRNNAKGEDGHGYDITYWDEGGTQFFVEVKSTQGNISRNEISFPMSINEYDVAKEKGKYYKIFHVSGLWDNKPQIINFTFDDNNVQKATHTYWITALINEDDIS